jgi:hypothetical protein
VESSNEAIFTSHRKVNLSTIDEKPSRKRLVELLDNPYPYKYRKPTSVTNLYLTLE